MSKVPAIIGLLIALTIYGAGQQRNASFPNNTAGLRGKAFMDFLNSKGDPAVREFLTSHVAKSENKTKDQRIKEFKETRDFLSGSKLRGVLSVDESADSSSIVFIIETSRGSFGRVNMKLANDAEKKIANISVERVRDPGASEGRRGPVRKVSGDQATAELKRYLDGLYEKDEFSGTVMIAKDGKPLFSESYGYADKQNKRENKLDTKFNIGSINKIFTILAIGMLADEGKLSFDDTIGKHLPDYPNEQARDKATIMHLLTMSSGIGDIFGPEFEKTPKSKLRTIDAYLPLFASKPLSFEPGTSRQYSNGGFLVLGAIIEAASGESYYDFVRERIYEPVGMKDTEAYEVDAKVPNMAIGYTKRQGGDKRLSNRSMLPGRGSSGGGGYSTAPDLLKFARALETGEFKAPKSLKSSKDRLLNMLGEGGLRFGGGGPGINAMVMNKIGDGYTIIVLSNYDSPSASTVARYIRDRLN